MAKPKLTGVCDGSAPLPEGRNVKHLAPLLRALGDEARLEIVSRLAAAAGPVCVCDLLPGLGLAQPTISHHLKVLRDASVVRSERRGSWVYYSLDLSIVGGLAELLAALAPPRVPAAARTMASDVAAER